MPRFTLALLTGMTSGLGGVALASCSSPSEEPPGGFGGMPPQGAGGALPIAGAAGAPVGGAAIAGAPAGGTPGLGGAAPVGGSAPGGSGTTGVSGNAGALGTSGTAGFAGFSAGGSGPIAGGPAGGGPVAGSGGATAGTGTGGSAASNPLLEKFSFFVASQKAMQELSGSVDRFGGDLRFGKADGLAGGDEICRRVAEMGMVGAGNKQWRAFLSVAGPPAVHARDRIGTGPWYDVQGRLVSENLTALLGQARPLADPEIANDLPNERGEPNHYVAVNGYTPGTLWDSHDTLTGSKADGTVYGGKNTTCDDWTSKSADSGTPRIGHSWPRSKSTGFGAGFASDHDAKGCTPRFNLDLKNGAGQGTCVGCGGGYGGIYCFALKQP